VDHKAVLSLGEKVGVGKESVVYEALGEIPLIIKFHRAGRTSFKHIRRSRYHLADRPRASWLYAAKLAASREFQVLERLHPQVSVPIPVGHSRNAVAMGLVDGVRLDRAVLEDPRGYLEEVLREVGGAWRLGLVHADLSEFNIFVHDRGITIIDWPQAVETDQNSSMRLLERDLRNILHFFSRRYKLELPLDQAISLVVPGAKVALLTQGVRS
jgi:RIO kinase 2